MIEVEQLTKVYRVPVKGPGLLGSVRSLWHREFREVRAVDDVSFQVSGGERIGFLGPNGAGKTTTLKMLTGLLHPSSGKSSVMGFQPEARNPAFLKTITLVMGQKQQLLWDLPVSETFALNKAMFDIPPLAFRETLRELSLMLDLSSFVDQPVRNLSLGQRMRAELAAALLHRPKVLFLDEPTIGMDVEVQALVRDFIADYNRRYEATVILTSHDMADVARIARRILVIDHGRVRYDGDIEGLQKRFGRGRKIAVRGEGVWLESLGFTPDPTSEGRFVATIAPEAVNPTLQQIFSQAPSADVTVTDPPLEDVLRSAFGGLRK